MGLLSTAVRDVRTGERVQQTLHGTRMSRAKMGRGRSRVWRSDSVSPLQCWIRKYLGRI